MTLTVGHRSYFAGDPIIHSYAAAGEPDPTIVVGRYCSIADAVEFLPGGLHQTARVSTWPWQHAGQVGHPPELAGPIYVGDDVWIGYGAKILGGVTIGTGAIVGAWSVVTRDVPSYHLAAGNPARHHPRPHAQFADALHTIRWWDWADDDPRLADVETMQLAEFVAAYHPFNTHQETPT